MTCSPLVAGLGALHPAPAGVEVAHDVALEVGRHGDVEAGDRLEHDRTGLGHGLAEGQPARDLEAHLRAVDAVVLAVDEGDPHVDDRDGR